MASAADELGRVALFADLSGRQRRKIAATARRLRFAPGTDVVREGTMGGISFFVVTDGQAGVSVGGVEVATLGPGDHFGEFALIAEAERTATVTARTELHCLAIRFADFRKLARANPDVMWKLLQHVVSLLQREPSGRHGGGLRAESARVATRRPSASRVGSRDA